MFFVFFNDGTIINILSVMYSKLTYIRALDSRKSDWPCELGIQNIIDMEKTLQGMYVGMYVKIISS